MLINISKADYIVFYDKKKLPPPPSILVTIDRNPLTKVKAKRVLGIMIYEDLTFTLRMEHITQKHKIVSNVMPNIQNFLNLLKKCNITDPRNNEIHSHRCTRIRTINLSY